MELMRKKERVSEEVKDGDSKRSDRGRERLRNRGLMRVRERGDKVNNQNTFIYIK